MPDDTPILGLPLILPAQAQKHVTHNEALRLLDILVQLTVLDRDLATPPAVPAEGDRYIVAANPTGAWAGQDGRIAAFWGGIWLFIAPREGWTARVTDEDITVTVTNGLWLRSDSLPETLPRLGIGTTPDATNRLSVVSPASLFNHAGTDHRMVLNKAAADDTASILLQSGFSGRAEIGLAGNNDLSVKVSSDGTAFATGLTMQASGAVSLPQGLSVGGPTALAATTVSGPATVAGSATFNGSASLAGPTTLAGTTSLTGPATLAGPVTLNGSVTGTAVQDSAQDGAAGKLLLAGAFGLGAASAPLVANLDATTTLAGTWRTVDVSTTGTWPPVATNAATRLGVLTVTRPDAATILQRWLQTDTATEWTRRNAGAGWSTWSRSLPVTGTVAMSAGQPTGAVIQRGTTATGDFVRFADGTQICTFALTIGPMNVATGAIFQGATNVSWTFPAAFAAAPAVSGMTASTGAWVTAAAPSLTSVVLRGCAAISQTAAVSASLMAIGRWV